MPHWAIEPVTSVADISAILEVEEASFTNPWTREMYLAELQHPEVSFIYAARDRARQIVGFCAFWRVLDELHINNLAVSPSHRREGVASALLAAVLREGTRAGASRATLEVRRSNTAAIQLYKRFGFSVAGVRAGYYTHPDEDALILWRDSGPGGGP
ncbi:MAG: ribosomal protein S18-alanine N-acetyltransferase [Vicinamibacterales bacterium]